MPVKECTKDGKPGYKWGDKGFCYTYVLGNEKSRRAAIARAIAQGRAIGYSLVGFASEIAKFPGKQDGPEAKERRRTMRKSVKAISGVSIAIFADGLDRLSQVPKEIWDATADNDAEIVALSSLHHTTQNDNTPCINKRHWQELIKDAPAVCTLVHEMTRLALDVDMLDMSATLFASARRAFESELAILAAKVGCKAAVPRLSNSAILDAIKVECDSSAQSFVETFNDDLMYAILAIRTETPTANRNVYTYRLKVWSSKRSAWKTPQLALFIETFARSLAASEFYNRNGKPMGFAKLYPRSAKCPVCQGWINRGSVPVQIALRNPGPFHPNCPHLWDISLGKFGNDECQNLWLGS